jgi:hypothetical protein
LPPEAQQCGKTAFSLDANVGANRTCASSPAVLQTADAVDDGENANGSAARRLSGGT